MAGEKLTIAFFTDQNVPDSVGAALLQAGHSLTRLRDVMDTRTADPVIAVACAQSGHVLVSHDSDFKAIAKRLQITQRQYHSRLHRVHMRCPEPHSAQRIADALSLIEFEWTLVREDRPMVIEISDAAIRVCR